ncbi:vanadium-dependent haloperoxidase [Kribbella sp. NPDC051137]|uniref:vanadium-dependent haloperoxidase n=1 Tax=Kribbella sp. NPDC051137 TaxID=3155045 RepID=UPI002F4DCA65
MPNYLSVLPRRRALTAALTAVALGATALTAHASAPKATTGTNVIVEWNRTLLSLVRAPGAQPATVQPTRDFAIMSKAVYDAVSSSSHVIGVRRTSEQRAAAAQAAHDVLAAMFPASANGLDKQLADDLAGIPSHHARDEGVREGTRAAAGILAARAGDGSAATPPEYRTTGQPGDFRPTPPGFAAPVFTHWGAVTPFVLRSADQFRPTPPPALSSRAYATALNEVESLGRDHSSTRTAEQTTIGNFWSAPIQNYWNEIADQVLLSRHSGTEASARALALLDLALADSTIALYDAKYAYRLWRPITAIRLGDTDRNRLTTADPTWAPLAVTPADPSYPGAHSALSAAAAEVLTTLYGDVDFTVTSPTLPGVTRSFRSFRDAAVEAGLSRIYAGVHTRVDHRAGFVLGTRVGSYVLRWR